jgi:uncharacterized surface protein with fasciclin (FAS1) repeats
MLATIAMSCSDEWETHYEGTAVGKSDLTLYENIKDQPDLSTFASMLAITGYDSVLSQSIPYTVWAPTNEALTGIDLRDTADVRNIVTNHIALFSCPVYLAKGKKIRMLNGKLFSFETVGSAYTIDGIELKTYDQALFNGMLHQINQAIPYRKNGWEYLLTASGIDSLQWYVNSLFTKELDMSQSYKDGLFVDSVFMTTNQMLTYLGDMDIEDSIYTLLLPSNQAWTEAYQRVLPYYKTLLKDGGTEAQIKNTKWSIARELVFRGALTLPLNKSSLQNTYGHTLSNPDSLFMNSQWVKLSNGNAYITDQWRFKGLETWNQVIRVEAEDNQDNTRQTSNYSISVNSSLGTGFNASNDKYITCEPLTSSSISKLFVTFPIPNTLSTKYNIYVVFVPTAAVDTSDHRPYKVNFYLTYINAAGKVVSNQKMGSTGTTSPNQMTKMLVAENFEFPYCNIVGKDDMVNATKTAISTTTQSYTTVFLKVENAAGVTSSELANFNRRIRIDCILLEPVQ